MATRPRYKPGKCELTRADGTIVCVTSKSAGETRLLAATYEKLGFVAFSVEYIPNPQGLIA